MIIETTNDLQLTAPKTYTTNLEVAGTNVLRWKNPNAFNASWAIQVGEVGMEQTEVVILGASTPSGTAGTLTANTLYEHPADTPIYGIKYNQVIFERSTTGTAGTATPITNGTITYQADHLTTQFDDTTGVGTYGYRTRYQSSLGSTSQSDWWTPAGLNFYSLFRLRQRIKDKLWSADFLSDSVIDDWINEWKDQMSNAVISVNEDYALGTVDVPFDTNALGTITTGDYKQIRRFEVTYNGNDFYLSTKHNVNDYA